MNDDMDAAYRRDSANERTFTDCARQIDALLSEPRFRGRMSGTTLENLRAARESLKREAEHLIASWN